MKITTRRLAVAAAATLAAASAGAQETTPYYIGGSVAYSHLSNVLGLPDGSEMTPALELLGYESKSDNVTSLALIGGIDQRISRQRIFGDVTVRRNDYSRNDLLDNDSYSFRGGLDWETIERVSGNVTLKSSRDLVKFTTFDRPTATTNQVTSNLADASVRIGVVTRWTFDAALSYRSTDYSARSYDRRDNDRRSGSVGARYWPSSESYIGLAWRATDGRYPRFSTNPVTGAVTTDNFDRSDVDLSGYLRFSDATSITARISHTDIDYEIQDSDFNGVTGFVRGVWVPRSALKLTLSVARDRGEEIALSENVGPILVSDVEAADIASVGILRADLALTAKTALNASARYSRRSITQTNFILGISESGSERATQLAIGATWAPTRTSLVGCDISREQRRSDVAAAQLNLTSDSASCYVQLSLEP